MEQITDVDLKARCGQHLEDVRLRDAAFIVTSGHKRTPIAALVPLDEHGRPRLPEPSEAGD